MIGPVSFERLIVSMNDETLEQFVRDWVDQKKTEYVEVARFSGSGDMGRDVVGFVTAERHDGIWDNYQCKQYGRNLPTANAIRELGKIIYHAWRKEFAPPRRYYFVAPRGVNRNLESLIYSPAKMRQFIVDHWDEHCAKKIVEGQTIGLDGSLLSFVESFDFSSVTRITVDDLMADPHIKVVLHKRFGTDPGSAPHGIVPTEIQPEELPYVRQLLDAYGERAGQAFSNDEQVRQDGVFGSHFARQRERYFDAAYFTRYYRDSTPEAVLTDFENDILNGVIDVCEGSHKDGLSRCDAVMAQAAAVHPSGALAQYARVSVKQGTCHHLANDAVNPKLQWRK
jgi:hypothetical protein